MQYRIPGRVNRIYSSSALIEAHRDENGRVVETRGPERWFVHFTGSTESLCFGEEKPDFSPGDVVDIIIRKRV